MDEFVHFSNEEAAEKFNVGTTAIKSAKQVRRTGTPELIKKVEDGTVRVSTAATIAQLPAEQQAHILAQENPKAILKAAKAIRSEQATVWRADRMTEEGRFDGSGGGILPRVGVSDY